MFWNLWRDLDAPVGPGGVRGGSMCSKQVQSNRQRDAWLSLIRPLMTQSWRKAIKLVPHRVLPHLTSVYCWSLLTAEVCTSCLHHHPLTLPSSPRYISTSAEESNPRHEIQKVWVTWIGLKISVPVAWTGCKIRKINCESKMGIHHVQWGIAFQVKEVHGLVSF